jgi:NitT/TauT family transport system ATP-binding protein
MSNIVLDQVSHSFQRDGKDFLALDNVSFTVADKEFVAVVGPSGCGKTTCLRLAAGLELAQRGSVTVGGKRVKSPGPDRAVVFQQFALFPWKTVRENISFGLRSLRVPREEAAERVARNLKLMGLETYAGAYPHQLSGGMQQRVAIARAYVLNPEVLLMDEPFGALDAQTRTVMQEELLRVGRANPRTVMFITHAVEEAVYLADRVIVMSPRPGTVKEIVAVKPVRDAEGWQAYEHIEDVMDLPSFMHLKTHIWRLLRDHHEPEPERPASRPRERSTPPPAAAPAPTAPAPSTCLP